MALHGFGTATRMLSPTYWHVQTYFRPSTGGIQKHGALLPHISIILAGFRRPRSKVWKVAATLGFMTEKHYRVKWTPSVQRTRAPPLLKSPPPPRFSGSDRVGQLLPVTSSSMQCMLSLAGAGSNQDTGHTAYHYHRSRRQQQCRIASFSRGGVYTTDPMLLLYCQRSRGHAGTYLTTLRACPVEARRGPDATRLAAWPRSRGNFFATTTALGNFALILYCQQSRGHAATDSATLHAGRATAFTPRAHCY